MHKVNTSLLEKFDDYCFSQYDSGEGLSVLDKVRMTCLFTYCGCIPLDIKMFIISPILWWWPVGDGLVCAWTFSHPC